MKKTSRDVILNSASPSRHPMPKDTFRTYGFEVGDKVCHVKEMDEPGVVTEIDAKHDLGDVTTCRVAWGASSLEEARAFAREELDIQWTNKLVRYEDVPA